MSSWESNKDTIGCIAWNTFMSHLDGDKKIITEIFKVVDKPFLGIFAPPVSHEGRLHAVEGYPS